MTKDWDYPKARPQDNTVDKYGFAKGVGNINSNDPGSGARYNSGKPAMELIPVWIISDTEYRKTQMTYATDTKYSLFEETRCILHYLGLWQKGDIDAIDILTHFDKSIWEDCANVFDYGRKKYAAWNWIKGMAWSIPVACIVRHALAILRGEELDPESGLPHRGHIACNLVMLAQYEQTFPEGDDRPIKWLNPNTEVDKTEKSR
jgi:hypothetical protein